MAERVFGLRMLPAAVFAGLLPALALAAGDPGRGRSVAAECASCHGAGGVSPSPEMPILAGQHEIYLINALRAYRSGARNDGVMDGSVHSLSDGQINDVAAFFAGRKSLGSGTAAPVAAAAAPSATPTLAGCPVNNRNIPETQDIDRDGLPDRHDAAPADASEFVRDTDGDGWYEICDIRQLQAIQTLGEGPGNVTGLDLPTRLARRYHLVRDLDASVIDNFQPIGQPMGDCGGRNDCASAEEAGGFAGSVDGGDHVIRKLRISWPDARAVGLFGVLAKTGSLRGIRLDDAEVNGQHGVGALVGVNFGLVADCRGAVTVSGRKATGALVGDHIGRLIGCQASGSVSGEDAVGGLVGDMRGFVARSYAETKVSGRHGVGGLAGRNRFASLVSSYATGKVSGQDNVGGLVGLSTEALVADSFSTAAVEATGTSAGGLVGYNSKGRIRNSYARGAVRGAVSVGGLAGTNRGEIRNSYATGKVKGESRLGGLAGDNAGGRMRASYWDRQSSNRVFGAGNDDAAAEGSDNNSVDAGELNTLSIYAKTTAALRVMTSAETGWHPSAQTAGEDAGDYYCDVDADGRVDDDERTAENLSWDFLGSASLPGLRCIDGGIGVQPLR